MPKKRVLLMYITEVSGHHQATKAIEKALKKLDPSIETMRVNGFKFAYPIIEKIVNKAYMGVIKRTPGIWDYLYDNPKVVKRTQTIKEVIHKSKQVKFARLFNDFNPDTVVCTQAFPCGMVADYKKSHNLDTEIIGVLTDFAPHSYWLHEGVSHYVVPSEEAKQRFVKEGVAQDRIKVFGIPVDPKFAEPLDRSQIIQKLGLDPCVPTILIMGGGQGLGPIKSIVKSLNRMDEVFQLIVVAGTNKKLIRWLKKVHLKSHKKILVYEYADNIEEFMEVSEFTITKPGGMTTAESLAKGLPLIIVKPIPGQEMRNTDFLIEKGIAVRINEITAIAPKIQSLLQSPDRIATMRALARAHGLPNSSFDIARLILDN